MRVNIFVDLDAVFGDGDVGEALVDPGSAVVVVGARFAFVEGGVSVSAEDAGGVLMARVGERARGDFWRQAQPARVEAIEKAGESFVF